MRTTCLVASTEASIRAWRRLAQSIDYSTPWSEFDLFGPKRRKTDQNAVDERIYDWGDRYRFMGRAFASNEYVSWLGCTPRELHTTTVHHKLKNKIA